MSVIPTSIPVADMLQEMQSGRIFSITFITLDEGRGTGGEERSYQRACILKADPNEPTKARSAETRQKAARQAVEKYYRDIAPCTPAGKPSAKKVRIHPPLVTHFNGLIVTAK